MPYNTTTALVNFFNTKPNKMVICNLITITTVGGVVLLYTTWNVPVTIGGVTFIPGPPHFMVDSIDHAVGFSTDKFQMKMSWPQGFSIPGGLPIITRLNAGEFTLASVQIDRAYAPDNTGSWVGSITRFFGEITDIQNIETGSCKITASSFTHRFDIDWPQNTVEITCGNTLYDAGCKVNPASYTFGATCTAGTSNISLYTTLSEPDHFFDKGRIIFTSGNLQGYSRMVRLYSAAVFRLIGPLPFPPSVGDTFNALKGCDKTMTTCNGTFSNLVNFAGFPFVPPPETIY